MPLQIAEGMRITMLFEPPLASASSVGGKTRNSIVFIHRIGEGTFSEVWSLAAPSRNSVAKIYKDKANYTKDLPFIKNFADLSAGFSPQAKALFSTYHGHGYGYLANDSVWSLPIVVFERPLHEGVSLREWNKRYRKETPLDNIITSALHFSRAAAILASHRACHYDYSDNNVLVDPEKGHVCIIDMCSVTICRPGTVTPVPDMARRGVGTQRFSMDVVPGKNAGDKSFQSDVRAAVNVICSFLCGRSVDEILEKMPDARQHEIEQRQHAVRSALRDAKISGRTLIDLASLLERSCAQTDHASRRPKSCVELYASLCRIFDRETFLEYTYDQQLTDALRKVSVPRSKPKAKEEKTERSGSMSTQNTRPESLPKKRMTVLSLSAYGLIIALAALAAAYFALNSDIGMFRTWRPQVREMLARHDMLGLVPSPEAESAYGTGMYLLKGAGLSIRNEDEGIRKLMLADNLVHPQAAFALGLHYFFGTERQLPDHLSALPFFTRAAEQGVANALVFLGEYHNFGYGEVSIDEYKARRYYEAAVRKNSAIGMVILGEVYRDGIGGPKDSAESTKYFHNGFRILFELGDNVDAIGKYYLGFCYYNGLGVVQDIDKGIDWYKQAEGEGYWYASKLLGDHYDEIGEYEAARGYYEKARKKPLQDGEAIFKLGKYYESALGVPEVPETAANYFEEAAVLGNTDAQVSLGKCYHEGYGKDKSEENAFYWYEQAANAGSEHGEYALGVCYRDGVGTTVIQDSAFTYIKKAAEKGNAGAQNDLGICYETGFGTPVNIHKAFECYEKSAVQGEVAGQANYAELCMIYTHDYQKGMEYFRRAASANNLFAQRTLGMHFVEGEVTGKNVEEGLSWLKKAAEQGDIPALLYLGKLYEDGKDVVTDAALVFEYYKKSAEGNAPLGAFALARCHEDGIGTPPNSAEAAKWYKIAADDATEHEKKAEAQYKYGYFRYYGLGEPSDLNVAKGYLASASNLGSYDAQVLLSTIEHVTR